MSFSSRMATIVADIAHAGGRELRSTAKFLRSESGPLDQVVSKMKAAGREGAELTRQDRQIIAQSFQKFKAALRADGVTDEAEQINRFTRLASPDLPTTEQRRLFRQSMTASETPTPHAAAAPVRAAAEVPKPPERAASGVARAITADVTNQLDQFRGDANLGKFTSKTTLNDAIEEMEDSLHRRKLIGKTGVPAETSPSEIAKALREGKVVTQGEFDRLKASYGRRYDAIEDSRTAAAKIDETAELPTVPAPDNAQAPLVRYPDNPKPDLGGWGIRIPREEPIVVPRPLEGEKPLPAFGEVSADEMAEIERRMAAEGHPAFSDDRPPTENIGDRPEWQLQGRHYRSRGPASSSSAGSPTFQERALGGRTVASVDTRLAGEVYTQKEIKALRKEWKVPRDVDLSKVPMKDLDDTLKRFKPASHGAGGGGLPWWKGGTFFGAVLLAGGVAAWQLTTKNTEGITTGQVIETIYGDRLREGGFNFSSGSGGLFSGNTVHNYQAANKQPEVDGKGLYKDLLYGDESILSGYLNRPATLDKEGKLATNSSKYLLLESFPGVLSESDFQETGKITGEGAIKALKAIQAGKAQLPSFPPTAPAIIGALVVTQSALLPPGSAQDLSAKGLLKAISDQGLGAAQAEAVAEASKGDLSSLTGEKPVVDNGEPQPESGSLTKTFIDYAQTADDADYNVLFNPDSKNASVIQKLFDKAAKGDGLDQTETAALKTSIQNSKDLTEGTKTIALRVFALN